MSTVYRDTTGSVVFKHPIGAASLTATVTDSTGATVDTQTVALTAGQYSYEVPWTITQYDQKFRITWSGTDPNTGNAFSRVQSFDVITPIVDLGELRTVWGDTVNPTDAEVAEVEEAVRVVIESYTGQPFGFNIGTVNYIGNGSGKILLKQRCNNLLGALGGYTFLPSDMAGNDKGQLNLDRCAAVEDGWVFLIEWPQFLTVKESPPMELINLAPSEDGTIRVPRRFYARKDEGVQYQIYAEWGYDEVPGEVQEAAMLLANDYLTNDSQYRDRYLEILKIQQDSFTYHPGAFRGTGNARADLLLGPYRRQNGMIIL